MQQVSTGKIVVNTTRNTHTPQRTHKSVSNEGTQAQDRPRRVAVNRKYKLLLVKVLWVVWALQPFGFGSFFSVTTMVDTFQVQRGVLGGKKNARVQW